jgi:hypothetical protein
MLMKQFPRRWNDRTGRCTDKSLDDDDDDDDDSAMFDAM